VTRRMPAEWEAHEATWMAWPTEGPSAADLDASEIGRMRGAWADVANAIARFEPVRMVVDPADTVAARALVDPAIDLVPAPLDDCWMRDMGPTFVIDDGAVSAVSWVFNGWGAPSWATWGKDASIAEFVASTIGVPVVASPMVNEGGGIHVDGRGAILLTETVQRGEGRNPDWSRLQVEEELSRTLGTTTAFWLPRGLTRDYDEFGTRGHVDIVACFAGPDTLLVHEQLDPSHPDHQVTAEVLDVLAGVPGVDLVAVPAPTVLRDAKGWVDYSYINHYVVNGAVILCSFDDPSDAVASDILGQCYPDREIVLVDARPIFDRGGGVHCITQQQPVVPATPSASGVRPWT
jgi:agmatine deiminase